MQSGAGVFSSPLSIFHSTLWKQLHVILPNKDLQKQVLAAQELGRQYANKFKLHFPWKVLPGATNPAMNHWQVGGQE